MSTPNSADDVLLHIEKGTYTDQHGLKHNCWRLIDEVAVRATGEYYEYEYYSETIRNPKYESADGRKWTGMVPTDFGPMGTRYVRESGEAERWVHKRNHPIGVRVGGSAPLIDERPSSRQPDLVEPSADVVERRQFPILGTNATVDWQFVVDHSAQILLNHGRQSIEKLASRGGLDWRELYAALRGARHTNAENDEAMLFCRKMERDYLAALSASPAPSQSLVEVLEQDVNTLKRLLVSAKVLQQNAEQCASEHHSHDFAEQGVPGWLADTFTDIYQAEQVINQLRTNDQTAPATSKVNDALYEPGGVSEAPDAGLVERAKAILQSVVGIPHESQTEYCIDDRPVGNGYWPDEALEAVTIALSRNDGLETEVKRLFCLLDDIDTLDDACKSNDSLFREKVRDVQRKRFDGGITTDGYTLDLSGINAQLGDGT